MRTSPWMRLWAVGDLGGPGRRPSPRIQGNAGRYERVRSAAVRRHEKRRDSARTRRSTCRMAM